MKQNKYSTSFIITMVGVGIFFYVYEYLLRIMPGVLVHEYRNIWHYNSGQIGMIDSAYFWAYTPIQPFVGAVIDRFGVRPTMLLAIFCCTIGCFFFNQEECFHLVITSRFLIGLGSGFAFISVLKLATEWLEPRYTNLVAGLATALGKAFAYGGIMTMTIILTTVGSDTLLYILFGIGVLLFITAYFVIHDTTEIMKHPETEQPPIFEGIFKAIRSPQVWLCGFIGGALYLHTMIFSNLWGIVFLQNVYGYSNQIAAQTASFTFLGWAIGGPVIGMLVTKYGHRRQWLISATFLATAIFSVIIYCPINNSTILNLLTFTLGLISSPQILVFPLAKDSLPPKYAGSAMSITNMIVMFGGLLGVVVGRMIEVDPSSIDLLQKALMIIPITTAIAFLMSFLLEDKAAYE